MARIFVDVLVDPLVSSTGAFGRANTADKPRLLLEPMAFKKRIGTYRPRWD